MAINERPGVYSSYEVESAVSGYTAGANVGCAAVGAKGAELGVQRVTSLASAVELFGTGGISQLVALALRNGAGAVYAVALPQGAAAEDYAEAFSKLCVTEGVGTMFCDSRDAAVHAAMKEAIMSASEAYRYRIGVVEAAGTVDELTGKAAALNCERMVLLAAEGNNAPGSFAAAFAGAVAGTSDPALPMNGAQLLGADCSAVWADGDVNTLVRGGVSLIESVSGSAAVLRAVTTRTTTGGAKDNTWRELTTVRIIDEVIPGIRDALRSRFARSKNTAQTRGAIRTQVIIELQNRLEREIIDGYGQVEANLNEADPTVCDVSFGFTVAHGLNHICLTAKITV